MGLEQKDRELAAEGLAFVKQSYDDLEQKAELRRLRAEKKRSAKQAWARAKVRSLESFTKRNFVRKLFHKNLLRQQRNRPARPLRSAHPQDLLLAVRSGNTLAPTVGVLMVLARLGLGKRFTARLLSNSGENVSALKSVGKFVFFGTVSYDTTAAILSTHAAVVSETGVVQPLCCNLAVERHFETFDVYTIEGLLNKFCADPAAVPALNAKLQPFPTKSLGALHELFAKPLSGYIENMEEVAYTIL